MAIRFLARNIGDPRESELTTVLIEPAPDCDGVECNSCVQGDDGELQTLLPHHHMLVSGQNPEAGPCILFAGARDSEPEGWPG